MLHEDGRDNSLDKGIFIHAVAPRHVECVALLKRIEQKVK